MKWFERLKPMIGRMALLDEAEAEALAKYAGGNGDHVEIGTLWGGTAILVALAKQDAGVSGAVYTIDPMSGGWWDTQDPMVGRRPTETAVVDNIKALHVTGLVHIVKAKSHPWPIDPGIVPTSILIDGDHVFETVAQDWRNASKTASKYILMHDCNSPKHPGIARAFLEVAFVDEDWELVEAVHSLAVFKRVKKTEPVEIVEPDVEPEEVEVAELPPILPKKTAQPRRRKTSKK